MASVLGVDAWEGSDTASRERPCGVLSFTSTQPDGTTMRRSTTAKLVAVAASVSLLATACSSDDDSDSADGASTAEQPGEGVTVTPARANWNTGFFQASLFRQMLEELGYDVADESDNELGPDIFYPALAQGEYDYWANGWFPLHQPDLDDTELPGGETVAELVTPVGFEVEAGALQGYLIDAATAEEYQIETLAQIVEDPELSALFDTDGDGVADLQGCNEGWGCAAVINDTIELNGWEDSLTHVQGEYSLLFTDVLARAERGESVLYYTWTPNFTVAQLAPGEDVVWLGLGAEIPEGQEGVAELGEGQCAADPCEMGFTPADIRVVGNNDFLADNPAAQALFEAVVIPPDDIYAQNLEMNEGADTQEDIDAAASQWIEDNREQVDSWLEEARAAA
jgi:glycine betaine/proline transport system substrate-binding protein